MSVELDRNERALILCLRPTCLHRACIGVDGEAVRAITRNCIHANLPQWPLLAAVVAEIDDRSNPTTTH